MSKVSASSTQQYLPIAGIQDNVLIMNDSSVRAVLQIDPINFELKSETEQNAIIYSYQAFLNSLDFPIQIVIQSKKLDLEQYLVKLQNSTRKNITNDLLRIQAEDYIDFVRRLISVANIMSKRFYVVVSYASITPGNAASGLSGLLHHKPAGPTLEQTEFERIRNEAYNRANLIAGGLSRLGLKPVMLDTQKLIELFYSLYNPEIASEERLTDTQDLSAGVVSSSGDTLAPSQPTQEPAQAPTQTPAPAVQPPSQPLS